MRASLATGVADVITRSLLLDFELRQQIRKDCSFCAGGRLQRKSNSWIREAYEAAGMSRVPHQKHIHGVLQKLEAEHNLCSLGRI